PGRGQRTDQGSTVTVAPDPPADQAQDRYDERRASSVNQDAEPEQGSRQRPGPDASAVRQVECQSSEKQLQPCFHADPREGGKAGKQKDADARERARHATKAQPAAEEVGQRTGQSHEDGLGLSSVPEARVGVNRVCQKVEDVSPEVGIVSVVLQP